MPHHPSLIEECARTAAGLLLTSYQRNSDNMLEDAPLEFLSVIRQRLPPALFAKRISAADLKILAASCHNKKSRPSEIFVTFFELANLSTLSVADLAQRAEEAMVQAERKLEAQRQAAKDEARRKRAMLIAKKKEEEQHEQQQHQDAQDDEAEAEQEEEHVVAKQEEEGELVREITALEHMAELCAEGAVHYLRHSRAPLDAARALLASWYLSVVEISTTVWSCIARSRRERELGRAKDQSNPISRVGATPTTTVGKLPSLIGVKQQQQQQHPSDDDNATTTQRRAPAALGQLFVLDHNEQKLGGIPKHAVKAVRIKKEATSALATCRADEVRSHVALVAADSAAAFELASLDLPPAAYPRLAALSSSVNEDGLREAELNRLCHSISSIVKRVFLLSENFGAVCLTQCVLVLRQLDYFRDKKDSAPQTVASPTMCALMGVEPRCPPSYICTIDGHRPVQIPNANPAHSVLVASALHRRSMSNVVRQKGFNAARSKKEERMLELQRVSMRPKQKMPGRQQRQMFADDVDPQSSLEFVLKARFASQTTSVLKKRNYDM